MVGSAIESYSTSRNRFNQQLATFLIPKSQPFQSTTRNLAAPHFTGQQRCLDTCHSYATSWDSTLRAGRRLGTGCCQLVAVFRNSLVEIVVDEPSQVHLEVGGRTRQGRRTPRPPVVTGRRGLRHRLFQRVRSHHHEPRERPSQFDEGQQLRVATPYPPLVQSFLSPLSFVGVFSVGSQ